MTKPASKIQSNIEELSTVLLGTLDEKIFFAELSKRLNSITLADKTKVYLIHEDSSAALICENGKSSSSSKTLAKGEGPVGHVVRTKKPYFSNTVSRDPLFHNEAKEGVKAELCMPIAVDGIVIASIHFQVIDKDLEFERDHMTEVLEVLNELRRPLVNMKMYLAAKHLNEALMKKIEVKEKELQESKSSGPVSTALKIEDKEIVGRSESMKVLLHLADKIAATDINSLLEGEAGTGKEMIARRIHCRSSRSEAGFATVDCTSLPEVQLEKELFGEEGDFTQIQNKVGLIESVNGGTLFINNIDALSLNLQSKLQRFLTDRMAFKVGGQVPYRSNVRILAATTKELVGLVQEERFREDLYYSLNTMNLRAPALRERREDIEILAIHFLNAGKASDEHKSLSPGALNALLDYHWPGNVREMQNVMERSYILSDSMIVERDHLADSVSKAEEPVDEVEEEDYNFSEMTLDELEKRHICKTLEFLSGNKTKTAKTLGITVKTLYNKLHSYGMIAPKEA
jgi:Nif-specific regulatory protein